MSETDDLFTAEQRAEILRMIAAAIPPSRWDVVHATYIEGMQHGYSEWIPTRRYRYEDGTEQITTLRNAVTGEVVGR